jgi:co-chaperonin GroES (HSP10)
MLRAIGDRVIAKRLASTEESRLWLPDPVSGYYQLSKGTFLLPDSSYVYEVVSVGPRCRELKVGDRFVAHWVRGFKVEHEGEEYYVFDEKEVGCTLERR